MSVTSTSITRLVGRPRRNRWTKDSNGVDMLVKDRDSTEGVVFDFTEDLESGNSLSSYVLTANGLTVSSDTQSGNTVQVIFSGTNGDFVLKGTDSAGFVLVKRLRVVGPRPVTHTNDYQYST